MTLQARFVHTNLVARDWQRLAAFYQDVFGCVPKPPERHYKGPDLTRGTGVAGTELHGVHLRLPGYGGDGPTLEIYTYTVLREGIAPDINRPGFGHIAFSVSDVPAARATVLSSGGSAVGDIVTLEPRPGSRVTWCYVRDPEGNVVELQSWNGESADTATIKRREP
jgi:predicted enzyme related to lactoylglutathione lyase